MYWLYSSKIQFGWIFSFWIMNLFDGVSDLPGYTSSLWSIFKYIHIFIKHKNTEKKIQNDN